jgi:hypothetical protein
MFNSEEAYRRIFENYLKLCKIPGWKDHAWHMVKELDKDTSGLFKGIKNDIINAMKEHNGRTK